MDQQTRLIQTESIKTRAHLIAYIQTKLNDRTIQQQQNLSMTYIQKHVTSKQTGVIPLQFDRNFY